MVLMVATAAESGEKEWSVFEGTWRFDGQLFHLVSERSYHVPKNSPEAESLWPDGTICRAPIGPSMAP